MPKKKKAGKNTKASGIATEKRKLVEADVDGQVYGILEKALGCGFFEVNCLDDVKRRCKARSKRMKVSSGDYVIVSIREFDEKTSDIIYKYDSDEVRKLQNLGILPSDIQEEDVEQNELENVKQEFDFNNI
jgi:translation initiation factor 1A